MQYISAEEASKKWGVSLRQVQRLLAGGRIPRAKKYARSWMIPADSEKPADPRREKKPTEKSLSSELAYIIEATTKYIPRDNPDIISDAAIVGEEWLRTYCEGALAYFRGDYARVIQCFRKIGGNDAAKLRYSSMAIAAAISTGDYPLYLEIETCCKDLIKADMGANVTAVAELTLAGAYVGTFASGMIPDWLKDGDFTALPLPLRLEAVCRQARYLHFVKKYESVLDVARTALAFDEPELGISYSGIYLRITCATACCSLNRMDKAEKYLLEAMNICLPHGFIVNFAELAPLFCGLLERLLKREYPAYYGAVIELSDRTVKNWLAFHNRFTKDNITLMLSPREYQLALLAAQGIPSKKIAERYHITVGSLNNTMQKIYEKLFISGKKELVNFIL